jgi:hypothetical protein
MIKRWTQLVLVISKAKVNISGAQLINVLNNDPCQWIDGTALDACAEANHHQFLCILTLSGKVKGPTDAMHTT